MTGWGGGFWLWVLTFSLHTSKWVSSVCSICHLSGLFSQLQYHEQFEKSKGHYTQISDDQEMKRLLANTQKTSLVGWHATVTGMSLTLLVTLVF